MTTTNHIRPLIVSALLLGAVAGQAFAATVTYTATSSTSTAINTNWTGTLVIPRFNATLGTLTQVSLVLSSSMTSSISIKNTGASPSDGDAATRLVLTVSNTDAAISGSFMTYFTDYYEFHGLPAGNTTYSGTLLGSADNITKNYTDGARLAVFTGTEQITFDTGATTAVTSTIGGSFETTQNSQAKLTGYVTYTYNVPEPACLGALAAGLCLTLRRRRR